MIKFISSSKYNLHVFNLDGYSNIIATSEFAGFIFHHCSGAKRGQGRELLVYIDGENYIYFSYQPHPAVGKDTLPNPMIYVKVWGGRAS